MVKLILVPKYGAQFEVSGKLIVEFDQPKFYGFPAWTIQVLHDDLNDVFYIIRSRWWQEAFNDEVELYLCKPTQHHSVSDLVDGCRGYHLVMSALYDQGYLDRPDLGALFDAT